MDKKMKIVFLVGEFPKMTETFILNQITGLIDEGYDLKIVSLNKSKDTEIAEEVKKYNLLEKTEYINVPRDKKTRLKKAINLVLRNLALHPVKTLKSINFFKYGKVALTLNPLYVNMFFLRMKEEFDIIHCHFGQRGLYGANLKDIGIKGKLITSFYGGDLSYFVKQTNKNIYKPLVNNGDLFLPLCSDFGDRLLKLGFDKEKIKVHHIGINLDKFSGIKHNFTEKETIIMTIARMVEKKGHKYLIEALPNIIKSKKNVKCIFVGSGELKESLVSLAKKLGVDKNIEFQDSVSSDKLPKLYAQAGIYVLPSNTTADGDSEGTPASIVEACASGLPIVSTYHAGIPEIVIDKVSGFLVNEKDSNNLAEKIIYLINKPKLMKDMGKVGREYVNKEYDIKIQSKKLIDHYIRVLNNKKV
ncbi:colanic acid biosynthesis glycosyltransferase WcaL [Candidatus Pacearchaeota archaeon CG10_big_fil_rev_8_21_14_0_10_31_9]|nr:MAG: colanic acid biosynthesis glycosyltransferase WcaL [Candidatus Pacearchaeota archaeon CG10_big_fil_rev_8_21_14_0_10_31_9]PIZ82976.1 MAG: colanic acid biosynthesis glycosyltransferase WcaL [Candidatus Pacearchaeota archaeon CG_4_10_14_0_2_um_filter_05_32_18]